MRYSRALIPTIKEAPADAANASHKLLVRGGYIRKVGAGMYDYLPLGLALMATPWLAGWPAPWLMAGVAVGLVILATSAFSFCSSGSRMMFMRSPPPAESRREPRDR